MTWVLLLAAVAVAFLWFRKRTPASGRRAVSPPSRAVVSPALPPGVLMAPVEYATIATRIAAWHDVHEQPTYDEALLAVWAGRAVRRRGPSRKEPGADAEDGVGAVGTGGVGSVANGKYSATVYSTCSGSVLKAWSSAFLK